MIRVHQPDFCRVGRLDIREMVQLIREHFRMIRAGQTARDFLSGMNFWVETGDFRGKFEEILWMEGGET